MHFILTLLLAAKLCVPYVEYTAEDVQILGDTMWLENGHTGKTEEDNLKCLILTGAVVVNRMKSDDKWWHKTGAKTIYDVIFAPGQYASATKNRIGKTDTPQWIYDLAEEILMYGTTVPDYVIYQSQQSRLGTQWCPPIAGEYFATAGGHYMEGKDVVIETNKQLYLKQCFEEFKKTITKGLKKYRKMIKIKQKVLTNEVTA